MSMILWFRRRGMCNDDDNYNNIRSDTSDDTLISEIND